MASTSTNVPVSEILRTKASEDDEPKKKSREDWRKAKELEEARKVKESSMIEDFLCYHKLIYRI